MAILSRIAGACALPTLAIAAHAQSACKDFNTSDWKMLLAPAGTPSGIWARLQTEVAKALAHPDTIATLQAEGSTSMGGGSQEAAKLLTSELQRRTTVAHESNAKLD